MLILRHKFHLWNCFTLWIQLFFWCWQLSLGWIWAMEQLAGPESNGLVWLPLIARQKCEFLFDIFVGYSMENKFSKWTLLLILSYPETSQVSTIKLYLFIKWFGYWQKISCESSRLMLLNPLPGEVNKEQ